jgi:hypothetical protein
MSDPLAFRCCPLLFTDVRQVPATSALQITFIFRHRACVVACVCGNSWVRRCKFVGRTTWHGPFIG